MEEQPHVLVVDDDVRLRELLARFLMRERFRVTQASDAEEARVQLAGWAFDIVVMDIMMPGEDGITLTRWMRANHRSLPVLLLTAMGAPQDRIDGLACGADDYLTKPFEPEELALRIRAILRRAQRLASTAPRIGKWRVDSDAGLLVAEDGTVRLTPIERRMLLCLLREPGALWTREAIQQACAISGDGRSVDVQVARLRRKIEPSARHPLYLLTVRGEGYRLRVNPEHTALP